MSDGEKYKPTEHDGKKEDGTEDKRVSSEHGFGSNHEEASKQGQKGGEVSQSEGEVYKPSEHDGLKKNGEPDARMKGN
ncbi:uncharacterized protein JCM6883_006336 [Sporobolomyces salmoneus]|uniref:uncharacterized protein n=1 Tax=Sporobolomyces salmoneus TaxID=183962 RepID=UPI003175D77B